MSIHPSVRHHALRLMEPIRVVVHGVLGKMGREVLATVCREPNLRAAGGADSMAEPGSLQLPDASGSVPLSNNLEDVLDGAQVVVDFTNAQGASNVMRTASAHGRSDAESRTSARR